jgi:3-hydroxybutyryl-CoA dehydrogenase
MAEVVAIVGAGTMGGGIAQVCLAGGHRVLLHDQDPVALADAEARIVAGLEKLVSRGRLDAAAAAQARGRLTLASTLAEAAGPATLAIEAAAEDARVKERVFTELDRSAPAGAILATNTSSLSVADCAAATRRPERVVGLHFFNPAPLMALVEVAVTPRTSERVAEEAMAFVAGLGKTPLACADSPGFVVNRVGRPYLLEALRLLEDGVASVADTDGALEGAGYPMGPFRLLDLIGLDVDLAIDERLFEAFGRAGRFEPSPLQASLVREGRLGRKTGHGFYSYREDGPIPDPTLPLAGPSGPPPPGIIVERLELAIINEAYRAVSEGVAAPPDVDLAMRLGAGHPRGPFERVDDLGLRWVVERLRALHEDSAGGSGDQFEVAALLWQMATV